jgi:3-methyladenine DNA glycosylase AlkD
VSRDLETAALADDAIARLRAQGDARRRDATLGYFPSRMENLGVGASVIYGLARELTRRLRDEPGRRVLSLASLLVARETLEGRQLAYVLLDRHRAARGSLTLQAVRRLGRGIDNWGSVDGFAGLVAGPAWRAGIVPDAEVERWAKSADRWWRRAALASTVALNLASRGGSGDTRRTLGIAERLADDHDDMVAKALSWALRVLARRDPEAVRGFLARHEGVLAARVRREVRNKLETGLKNPKRGRDAVSRPGAAMVRARRRA